MDELFEILPEGMRANERLRVMALDQSRRFGSIERAIKSMDDMISRMEYLADTPEAKQWVRSLARDWDKDRQRLRMVHEACEELQSGMDPEAFERLLNHAVEKVSERFKIRKT